MQYEYDPNKSSANKEKHGIDFEEAKALWDDPWTYEIAARSDTELRFAVVGLIGEIHWTAFITYRGEAVRIISVRRARNGEETLYEQAKNQR